MAKRSMLYTAGLVVQSVFYLFGGANHFWHSGTYTAIMPPHYAHPLGLVQISGAAEILGAVGLLVPATRKLSAWGIIAMLVVYFDVHFYMLRNAAHFAPIPAWALYARLPLQLVLIAWAWVYTRPTQDRALSA
ncbi:MAG: DoxX family protein [Janthinobacterium lividum]